MGSTIDEQRQSVLKAAQGWIGTPYQPCQALKGRGCDCGSLLMGIFAEAGLIPQPGMLQYDWLKPWAKRGGDEIYLKGILEHASEILEEEAKPADIVLYHVGRGWSHAALIVEWPRAVIHALRNRGVVQAPGASGMLSGRQRRFFSFWTN